MVRHTQLRIRYQETRRQLTFSENQETSSWRKKIEAAMTAITATTVRFVVNAVVDGELLKRLIALDILALHVNVSARHLDFYHGS